MTSSINDLIHIATHNSYMSGRRSAKAEIKLAIRSAIKANKAYEQFGLRVAYKENVLNEVLKMIDEEVEV